MTGWVESLCFCITREQIIFIIVILLWVGLIIKDLLEK